jgi:tetratricopeptide (TPR) repeat protein
MPHSSRLRILFLITALSLFLFLFLFALRNIYDYDYWWHAATGKYIVQNRSLMRGDVFSFTASGAPVLDPYWLAQIVLYEFSSAVVVMKSALICCAFCIALLAISRQMRFSVPSLALLFVAIFSASERFLERPEIFSLLFTAIFFVVLIHHERRRGRLIFLLPVLMLVWVNMHPGWVVGILLILCFVVGSVVERIFGLSVRKAQSGRIFSLILVFLLCAAASFLNPYGLPLVLHPFSLGLSHQFASSGALEWRSPLPDIIASPFSLQLVHYKILVAAAVISFILNHRRFRFSSAFCAAMVFLLSLTSYRHIALFSLLTVPIAAENFSEIWQKVLVARPRLTRTLAVCGSLLLIAGCGYYSEQVVTDRYYAKRHLYQISFGTGVSDASYPEGALKTLLPAERPLRLFHNYEAGGFISHFATGESGWFSPRFLVFLDGRFMHYPPEVFDWYIRISCDPSLWESFADRFKIDRVVLLHSFPRLQGLVTHLVKSRRWRLTYLDSVSCVFAPESLTEEEIDAPAEFLKSVRSASFRFDDCTYPGYHAVCAGRMLLILQRWALASEFLERTSQIYPDFPELVFYLGRARAGEGRFKEAQEKLKEAAALLPDNLEVWQSLATVSQKLGDSGAAENAFRNLLRLHPDNLSAVEFLQKAKEGKR